MAMEGAYGETENEIQLVDMERKSAYVSTA